MLLTAWTVVGVLLAVLLAVPVALVVGYVLMGAVGLLLFAIDALRRRSRRT